jgi:hypothetical protein
MSVARHIVAGLMGLGIAGAPFGAIALHEQGASSDAVDWLEKAVKINGQSAQHHQWLGTALRAEAPKANMLKHFHTRFELALMNEDGRKTKRSRQRP